MGFYSLSSGEFFVCTLLVYHAHHEKDGHVGIVLGKAGPGGAQQDEIQVSAKGEAEDDGKAKVEAEDVGKGYERMQDG